MNDTLMTFNALCARVLQLPEESIVDTLSPPATPSWDSFNALTLVSELESQFKIRLTQKEVRGVRNIGGVKEILRMHGVAI
jgi:acyl carrier protein